MSLPNLAKNKQVFLASTCVSVVSLVGAFGYPLQQVEVYKQPTLGAFDSTYDKVFILTDADTTYPYGFKQNEAIKVSHLYQSYGEQKWIFLLICIASSSLGYWLGLDIVPKAEIDEEVQAIKNEGKKHIILENAKHTLAMASKAQRLQFVSEIRELADQFETVEAESLDAEEANEDKFVSASYLEAEGYPLEIVVEQVWGFPKTNENNVVMQKKYLAWKNDTEEDEVQTIGIQMETQFRHTFPEQMDGTVWKAVLSSQQQGATKESIIKDVLNCTGSNFSVGEAYLKHLKNKFGI